MRTDDLDYDLDPALVATHPAVPRDAARLLVFERSSGRIEHRVVRDLVDILGPRDTLVVNQTSVAPARIKARRAEGTARIEGLLLRRHEAREWTALLKNARRVRDGERLHLVGPGGETAPDALEVLERDAEGWRVRVLGGGSADEVLARIGWTPLPPYILAARKAAGELDDSGADREDRRQYQTVYAAPDDRPSVAAPTAGLHFTEPLLAGLAAKGVERVSVSLQVGAGTFRPVETERVEDHLMHEEWCLVTPATLESLRSARAAGRRIVAVGTTAVRTLESLPHPLPEHAAEPLVWSTRLLIQPGHRFALVDALLTNFHLPRSTLLALVAAFVGLDELRRIYAAAMSERYRFYSFGDAMLVL